MAAAARINITSDRGSRNFKNAVLALAVPLPSILFYLSFLRQHNSHSPVYVWCYNHPFLLASTLFFLNITLLLWAVSIIQDSNSMIDLYWTAVPVMLVHYFATHPLAESNVWRSRIVIFLTSVWSIRFCHSYFRRERWQLCAREDWRFSDLRLQYGQNWWWVSFFAVYLPQQVFLTGNCLPIYVVHSKDQQLNVWDLIATSVCLSGVTVAYYSDTQLHNFVIRNERLEQLGKPLVPVLEDGLWHYSRHPNYFGEQLWWWGLVIFAWNLGSLWTVIGALINSWCLAQVTVLVERRMMKRNYRREAYARYRETTSVWIPWCKKSVSDKEKKT